MVGVAVGDDPCVEDGVGAQGSGTDPRIFFALNS